MKKRRAGRLILSKETLRALDSTLRNAVGGRTELAACNTSEDPCTTWGGSDCGDCTSVNKTNCSCPGGWCPA